MHAIITSPSNEHIKYLKKLLRDKGERDSAHVFVVENLRIVTEAGRTGVIPKKIYLTADMRTRPEIASVLAKIPDITIIDERVNESFSTLKTAPGIAAVYDRPRVAPDYASHTVYCNGVSDPGNLGAIVRTAAAFGFGNVIADETCADFYNPKTLQAAKDAVFRIKLAADKEYRLFARIKQSMPVYAAVLNGTPLTQIDLTAPPSRLCLVLGSESGGVAAPLLKAAVQTVTIPLSGGIDSLNVAVACGILLHALRRRH